MRDNVGSQGHRVTLSPALGCLCLERRLSQPWGRALANPLFLAAEEERWGGDDSWARQLQGGRPGVGPAQLRKVGAHERARTKHNWIWDQKEPGREKHRCSCF